MTIRKQVLLITGITIVTTIALLYIVSRITLINDLERIEKINVEQNVIRTQNVLSHMLEDIEINNADWASWDDTYQFIEDKNEDYINANLCVETFLTLELNIMVFSNKKGQVVFSKAVDLDSNKETGIPQGLLSMLEGSDYQPSIFNKDHPVAGFILLDKAPMYISSQPILKSDDSGPIRGMLIFGRYIGSKQVKKLSTVVGFPIAINSIKDLYLYPDFQKAITSISSEDQITVQALDQRRIAGYTFINDINDRPILLMRVENPRDIFQAGQLSVYVLILSILGLILLTAGLAILVINKTVFSRFASLIKGIENIRQTGDTKAHVSIGGSDELSVVAGTINGMLDALEQSYLEIKESERKYRIIANEERASRKQLENEIDRRIKYTRALVHELKTPITPVLASSDILLEEIKSGPLLRVVRNINEGVLNLNNRIDELLDLARTEIGTLNLKQESFEPKLLLENIYKSMMTVAQQNDQKLLLELPAFIPRVHGDKGRIQQVIFNLLNNAMKFTPKGGQINLRAGEENDSLIVEIQDTGRGISRKEQQILFEPYYRSESDRARLSGLGLGLVLSKRFVEMHGGQIWVKSQKGKGSVFAFSIPIKP